MKLLTWCRLRNACMLVEVRHFGGRDDAGQHRPAQDGLEIRRQAAPSTCRRSASSSARMQRKPTATIDSISERVEAAAGEHAIRELEQIERQGHHQEIDEDREDAHGDQSAARQRMPAPDRIVRVGVGGSAARRRKPGISPGKPGGRGPARPAPGRSAGMPFRPAAADASSLARQMSGRVKSSSRGNSSAIAMSAGG